MRKKGHKRINPDNKEYDKYFLVNYVGDSQSKLKHSKPKNPYKKKSKPQNQTDCDHDSNADSDPDWSEWTEENGPQITCLLCEHMDTEYENILDHMEQKHEFSFTKVTSGLNFYHKVKFVNYVRRQMHLKQCLSCELKFDNAKNLEKHLVETKHWVLKKECWDQPEYYFPTYEDDLFLCFIHDDDESWWSSDDQEVEKRNSMSESISTEMAMAVLNEGI